MLPFDIKIVGYLRSFLVTGLDENAQYELYVTDPGPAQHTVRGAATNDDFNYFFNLSIHCLGYKMEQNSPIFSAQFHTQKY